MFKNEIIGVFNFTNPVVVESAVSYLTIIASGILFFFLPPLFSGIYSGYGNGTIPFVVNAAGLLLNIVLDPLFIFGLGGFPKLGIEGAAIATVVSQFLVTIAFIVIMKKQSSLIGGFCIFKKPDLTYLFKIIKMGYPVGLQSGLFSIFAIIVARIVASWGEVPVAILRVGAQLEALSWMTASGFSTALSSYTGQNFGAGKWDRIKKGYKLTMALSISIALVASYLFYFHSSFIFSLFIPEEKSIVLGAEYLEIIALSQIFMSMEIVTAGAFIGLGKTFYPALISIVFTAIRIPGAIILSAPAILALNGVWWSINISSILKGVILTILFMILIKKSLTFEHN